MTLFDFDQRLKSGPIQLLVHEGQCPNPSKSMPTHTLTRTCIH